MAGVLPGVECARRRRLHQGGRVTGVPADGVRLNTEKRGTRRSSFCLYSNANYQLSAHRHPRSHSLLGQEICGMKEDKLAKAAIEAKARLDERLKTRACPASNMIRADDEVIESRLLVGPLHEQAFDSKKGVSVRKFILSKLSWKLPRRNDCAVCPKAFKVGDLLVHLPCIHYFHSNCIIPCLKAQSICPCRKQILLFEKPQSLG